jgi:predicted nuclease of predicted toxin-antitoxin system
MRFKIDENLPVELAELLRNAGHDAHTVGDEHLQGQVDPVIIEVCRSEERALITLDQDFADLRVYPPAALHGLVVLRLSRQDRPHVLSVFQRVVPLFELEQLPGHLWIVEESQIRIRGGELPPDRS